MCLEIGASVIPKKEKTNYIKRNEYRVAEQGKSWKFKLINAIDLSLVESSNKEEFIKSMNKLGYQVNWTDTRIRRYRTLSKQAMKEYAMKKANSSSFDWYEDEEEM